MTERREKKQLFCPYCDVEITEAVFSYCETCGVEIFHCPKCRQPVSRDNKTCPHCGADIKKEAAKGG